MIALAIKEGRARHIGRRVKKGGIIFWGSILITALHDDDGNVIGFTKLTREVSDNEGFKYQMMKTIIAFLLIVISLEGFAQDSLKIKQIDVLVSEINSSTLPVQRDTITQNHPEMGLTMITYLTMLVYEGELIRYVNHINTSMTENGATRQMTGSNTFYYNHNTLIKVEEYLIEAGIKREVAWYYANDKPLYYTLQSDKAEARAILLLSMSKTMLKQVIK